MMKNKVKLKRNLIIVAALAALFLCLCVIMNVQEYRVYTGNFNKRLTAVVSAVREKYPQVTEEEIVALLNRDEKGDTTFLQSFGIYPEEEALLLENNQSHRWFLLLDMGLLLAAVLLLTAVFLHYDYDKDKEIAEITKYIEEINRRNYSLHMDELSEDELSILKNEIYKTTIMLKESADNSLRDKKELKKSLEDISHQLKTPLTSILVILDNIIDDPDMDNATREDFVRDIKREVTGINFLVQAILKLSKFDADTIHFVREKRLLQELVSEAVKNVAALCDLKNIEIESRGDEAAEITCDFMWQVEAVTNLIKNCIDHSGENGRIIIAYEQNKVYSSITIRDFGEGIAKADLPHIFERFYKGKNASPDSVGIGLALAKTIVEEDNGTISVDAEPDGTRFVIKYFRRV